MIIRESTKEDLPNIIALLKLSIGEVLTPKTEGYFLWKHGMNAFGPSKVLLAIEDGRIIGLRAFMRWSWVTGNESVSAVRAVDTATDPAFQGKGIFKKLTLQVVEDCKAEGVGMVFNSPNPISMQGYLKMGWKTAGRLPLYIGLGSLLPRGFSLQKIDGFYNVYSVEAALKKISSEWSLSKRPGVLHTPIGHHYLAWRYRDCPIAKYGVVIEPGQFGFIFRFKKMKSFMELRICEVWTENDEAGKAARAAFRKLVQKTRPAMVTCSASPLFLSGKKQVTRFFGPFNKGPIITIRPLVMENLYNFEQFHQWQPSLGSMELF